MMKRLQMMRRFVFVFVLCWTPRNGAVVAKNMNGGDAYKIANSESFSTEYDNAEYFDVYSPKIQSLYSQVVWNDLGAVPLPAPIVERFANRTMAVVGYEVDQVFRAANSDEEDVSVPITHAYNHHYCAWLVNQKRVRMVEVPLSDDDGLSMRAMSHGMDTRWMAEPIEPLNDVQIQQQQVQPLVQFFSEGNGGEFRKSHHGFPLGFAQLIHAPDTFRFTPMQIDTWNRDAGTSSQYRPQGSLLPRRSKIPTTAGYNGLVECPCSDRVPVVWHVTHYLQPSSHDVVVCDQPVQTAKDCWSSAQELVSAANIRQHVVQGSASNDDDRHTHPAACSLQQHVDGSTDVYWNEPHQKLEDVFIMEDTTSSPTQQQQLVAFASGPINVTVAITFPNGTDSIGDYENDPAVTLTLTGPASAWFGLGLGSDSMCTHLDGDQCPDGGPYAIIVSGDAVEERKLEYHGKGRAIASSVTIISNAVDTSNNEKDPLRTVVVTRALKGLSPDHYTFAVTPSNGGGNNNKNNVIPMILAKGCALEFAQHCGHAPSRLEFLQVDSTTQICQGPVQGNFNGRGFTDDMAQRCPPPPRSDLGRQANAICNIETYRDPGVGGLFCCNHGMFLLDQAQEIPWQDQPLEYHLKFRFYFQEYHEEAQEEEEVTTTVSRFNQSTRKKPSHTNLVRFFATTEGGSSGEYDVPPCPPGTPSSHCVHTITSRFPVSDMVHDCDNSIDNSWCSGIGSSDPVKTAGIELIYVGPHCHAPSCLSMELYNSDTGQLLCRMEPVVGSGDPSKPYDEFGFMALPPCLWGRDDEGLSPPVLLPLNTTLLSIKRNNNTLAHSGEMAFWQMRGIVIPRQDGAEEHSLESEKDEYVEEVVGTVNKVRRRHGREE